MKSQKLRKIKKLVYDLLCKVLFYSGLVNLSFLLKKKNVVYILMGHRVEHSELGYFGGVSKSNFKLLIDFIYKYLQFVSSDELFAFLKNEKTLNKPGVLLTFDDGFRDNYLNAFPILKEKELPATIYLVYNSIENQTLPWSQRLGYILEHSKRKTITIKEYGIGTVDLSDSSKRRMAYAYIKNFLLDIPCLEKEQFVDNLSRKLGAPPPIDKMLTWKEIEEMQKENITFGAHTLHHPILNKISKEEAQKEILESKKKIEEKIHKKVEHFAFPVGSDNKHLINYLKEVGLKTSYVKKQQNQLGNSTSMDPNRLVRVGIYNDSHINTIVELSGILKLPRTLFSFAR